MPEVTHEFTIEEARSMMPEVVERAHIIVRLRSELAELTLNLYDTGPSASGGLPEAKALEAHLNEALSWFLQRDIEVKGIAPLLIDFPGYIDGHSVRLCWLEGETALEWYHRTELGFAGRRRLE